MGDVYEATDLDRGRLVALKLLPELFSNNNEFEERFRRESRVAARLRDPHIIPIHDYGEIDRRLFIEMRLVEEGLTLASLLRDQGALPPDRAVRLLVQIAEALDSAHDDGLIHRDVKPSNVMVTSRDFVYVIDFGIAHTVGETRNGLTVSGSTVGTLDYMAPERFSSDHIDRRVDIYSLACLLYQCLTAKLPFDRGALPAMIYAHLNADPPRPSDVSPRVPEKLNAVVAQGMAKNPGDRYPRAGALAEAARRAIEDVKPIDGLPPQSRRGRGGAGTPIRPSAPRAGVNATRPLGAGRGSANVSRTESVYPGKGISEPSTAETTRTEPARGSGLVRAGQPPAVEPPRTVVAAGRPPGSGAEAHNRRGRTLAVGAVVAVLVFGVLVVVVAVARSGTQAASTPAQGAQAASQAAPALIGSIPTPPTPGYMRISPDGRVGYITNRSSRALTVLELGTRAPVATIPMPASPRFIAFGRTGTRAYVSCYDGTGARSQVTVVNTQTYTVTAAIPVDEQPYALAVAPDQRELWVPSHSAGSIDLVNVDAETVTRSVSVAPNPHGVVFAADRAYVVNHESDLVTVLDPTDAALLATVPVGRSPHSIALSPDGSRVAVANRDGDTVSMINTTSNQVSATIPVGQGPQNVAYAPDGRHLYTANVNDGTVSTIDANTNQVTSNTSVGSSPTSVAPAPDGRLAYVTLLDEARVAVLSTGH
jgi:serine/threonine-protein kinase